VSSVGRGIDSPHNMGGASAEPIATQGEIIGFWSKTERDGQPYSIWGAQALDIA